MRFLKTAGSYLIGFGAFVVAGLGCSVAFGKFIEAKNLAVKPDVALVILAVTLVVAAAMFWGSWVLGRPQEGDYFKA